MERPLAATNAMKPTQAQPQESTKESAKPPQKAKKVAQGAWTASVRKALQRAEAKAAECLARGDVTKESVEAVLAGIEDWPTQARPNVSPDEKAVTGMCLGAVNVLGGVGMQVSAASQNYPSTTKLVAAWTRAALPEFPFSSLQVNYNYAAKKHVDGNNIGPSYIVSLGEHEGGELWVADTFVEKATDDGGTVLRGGGGESVVNCHRKWSLFDGNSEHYTMPYRPREGAAKATRISIVAFTHSSYNKLDAETAADLKEAGFTAGSSDGEELEFFKSFRIDKSELAGDDLAAYLALREARKARPAPSSAGSVGVECNGYSAGKGAGWFSFVTGARAKRARIDSFFKPKTPKKAGPVTFALPKRKNPVSTNLEKEATVDDDGVVRVELPKNRVGLWFLDLDPKPSGLACVALERFDLYNKVEEQTAAFHAYVEAMPAGRVALISITDTAMAKTRPLPRLVYDTLKLLGGPEHIEPIGYRMPFAFVGVRGAPEGSASLALDKTKIILRLEGVVRRSDGGAVELVDKSVERFDITEAILESKDEGGEAAGAAPPTSAAAPDQVPPPPAA